MADCTKRVQLDDHVAVLLIALQEGRIVFPRVTLCAPLEEYFLVAVVFQTKQMPGTVVDLLAS